VNLSAFFKTEFAEHHDVARSTEAALADAFAGLVRACTNSIRGGGKLMFLGNGGSAADAQHLATELTIRYKRSRAAIAALALTTDTSALTAVGNDLGFEQVFARQIEALGKPGDVVIATSTSGKSPNVIAALKENPINGGRRGCFRRERWGRHGSAGRSHFGGGRPPQSPAFRKCTSCWGRCCVAPWKLSSDWSPNRPKIPEKAMLDFH
jgi:phosphoheptose isomerase